MDKIVRTRNSPKNKGRHAFIKSFVITMSCLLLILAGYFGAELINRFFSIIFR